MAILKKFIKSLNGQPLYPSVSNCAPFIHASDFHTRRFYGKYYSPAVLSPYLDVIRGRDSFCTIAERFFVGPSQEVFSAYLKDQGILETRLANFADASKRIDGLYATYSFDRVAKLDWPEGIELVLKIRDLMWDANALAFFSLHFDKDFCLREIGRAGFAISAAEVEEIWERATHPTGASFDKVHFMDVARAVIAGQDWEAIAESCQYIGTSYLDAKSREDMLPLLKERYGELANAKIAQVKLDALLAELETQRGEFESWMKGLSPNQQALARYLQAIIGLRDQRKNFFCKGIVVMWRTAEHLFRKAGVDAKGLMYYTVHELEKGPEYLKAHAQDLARRRDGFLVLIDEDGNTEMELGNFDEAKKVVDAYYLAGHQVKSSAQELKGQIGCPGKTTGKVKVVLSIDAGKDFKEGEILVAGMTRPEYVPLMKKSAAIITDEGGITCHAAIVSRELKKPCIIGTKVATKLLKDGDEVEVDADKGIVRILKRA